MPFLVIEHSRDNNLLRERFQGPGRILPENLVCQASRIEPATDRGYQVMEVPDRQALTPWTERWNAVVDFEVIPGLTPQKFWERGESKDFRVAGH